MTRFLSMPSIQLIRIAARCAVISSVIGVAGCRATILKPTEADDSRRQVQRLADEVRRLEAEVLRLQTLVAVERVAAEGDHSAEMAAVPFPVRVDLARWSGPVRPDVGRSVEIVRLYLRPIDAHERFAHPLGPLEIEVLAWSPDGTPNMVAVTRLERVDLVALYRSGPMGTHYTVEIVLTSPLDVESTVIVRGRLFDDLTGRVTPFERSFAGSSQTTRSGRGAAR